MLGGVAASGVQASDSPAKSIQQALKKRGFYLGEPSGTIDESTSAALKRFQIHEGLAVTGEIDTATVKALQNEGASSNAAPTSAASTSVQQRPANVVQSDKEFLERVETAEQKGPSPPSRQSAPSTPDAVGTPEETVSSPHRVGARDSTERAVAAATSQSSAGVSETDARAFVEDYLQAAQAPAPGRELSFYADKVDYFDSGKVKREFIEKDQARYYRRWPSRDFKLLGAPQVERTSTEDATVRFRIRYSLRGEKEHATGQAENEVRLRKSDARLEIIGIRERKIPQ
jgi:hypothetical protein